MSVQNRQNETNSLVESYKGIGVLVLVLLGILGWNSLSPTAIAIIIAVTTVLFLGIVLTKARKKYGHFEHDNQQRSIDQH